MRILYAINAGSPANPFTLELLNAVRINASHVAFGLDTFMRTDMDFDVVHIQWPESLFSWKDSDRSNITRIRKQLLRHRRRARIVTTVHNCKPQSHLRMGEEMFEIVHSATDDFVHLGRNSKDAFIELNHNKPWALNAAHHVIQHGEYSYYRKLPRDDTLAMQIGAARSGPVILVFGVLRDAEEERLARVAFLNAGIDGALLVFAGALFRNVEIDNVSHPSIMRFHSRVPECQVAPLLEAVDMVFIPRRGRLNSGVVSLALTFGVPIIGPNEGVIGEQLTEFGGILYEPGSDSSGAAAMRAAAEMDEVELTAMRERMESYRRQYMLWSDIAAKYMTIYSQPIQRSQASRWFHF